MRDSLLGFESDLVAAKDLLLGNCESVIVEAPAPLSSTSTEIEIDEHLKALEDNANTSLVKSWLLKCIQQQQGIPDGDAGIAAITFDVAVRYEILTSSFKSIIVLDFLISSFFRLLALL